MSREESGTAARLPAAGPPDDATDLDGDPDGAPDGGTGTGPSRRVRLLAGGGVAALLVGWVLSGGPGLTATPTPAPSRSAATEGTAGDLSLSLTPTAYDDGAGGAGDGGGTVGSDGQRVTFLLVNQSAATLVVRSVQFTRTAAVRFDGWAPIRVAPGGLLSREGVTDVRCSIPVPRMGPPGAGTARLVVTWNGGPERVVEVPVYGYADRLVGVDCPPQEPGVHVTAVDAAAVGEDGEVRVRLVNHGTVSVQVAAVTRAVPAGLVFVTDPALPLDLPPGELRTVVVGLGADCDELDRRALARRGAGLTLEARTPQGYAAVAGWPARLLSDAVTRAVGPLCGGG
jgi:hypothetical protein